MIRAVHQARRNWDSAFEKMAQFTDDVLLDPQIAPMQNPWDAEEWEWSE